MNSCAKRARIGAFARAVVIAVVAVLVLGCLTEVVSSKEKAVKPRIEPGDGDGVGGYKDSETGETITPGACALPPSYQDPEADKLGTFPLGPVVLWGPFYLLNKM